MYDFDLSIIIEHAPFILGGVVVTIQLVLVGMAAGSVIGLICALIRVLNLPVLAKLAEWYVEVFRNTPILVQIVGLYYAVPIFLGVPGLDALYSVMVALSLNMGAYLTEVFRGGIQSIPIGQTEAAYSLGMSYGQNMRYIILPQAIRRMLPSFVNTFVVLIKESAQASIVGVMGIFHRGDIVTTTTYKPLESYAFVALLYFLLCYLLSKGVGALERKTAIYE